MEGRLATGPSLKQKSSEPDDPVIRYEPSVARFNIKGLEAL